MFTRQVRYKRLNLGRNLHKKGSLNFLYYVLEITVRSAADLLCIQANSAILFYRKIREIINYYLVLQSDEIFAGQIELDESNFDSHCEGK